MRYLVVVPARGGSKGIKKKNIAKLCGKPLILYTLECMKAANINGDIVVSSEDEEILQVAKQVEGVIAIRRPRELAMDNSSTEDALIHALNEMRNYYQKEYDVVITAQPTSPLRKVDTVKKFINEFEKVADSYDAQITFTENRADMWVNNNGFCRLYPNAPRRRQEREPLYVENSMLYATKIGSLMSTHSVLGTKVNGFVISEIEGIDINEPIDLKLAEFFLMG